jgi:serine phosphatase RsbU (regulator of sigma subunit)/Tfp pilus assembly protein PilF
MPRIKKIAVVKCLLVWLLLPLPHICLSQQSKGDSLEAVLKSGKLDTSRFRLLNKLYNLYRANKPEKALSFAEMEISDARQLLKLSGITEKEKAIARKAEGTGFQDKGVVYHMWSEYKPALENYQASLKIRTAIKDSFGLASIYNNLGRFYHDQGDFPEAMHNYSLSLGMREALKDQNGVSISYVNIAGLYYNQKNDTLALKYFLKALEIQEKAAHKNNMVIAPVYSSLGSIYRDRKEYALAESWFLKSLALRKTMNDLKGISSASSNLAGVYLLQEKFDLSYSTAMEAMKIKKELKDVTGMAILHGVLGNLFMEKKEYRKAAFHYQEDLNLSKQTGNKEQLQDAYEGLALSNRKLGNYKEAYEYLDLFSRMKDSILNVDNSKLMNEMNVKYETEKKDLELLKKDATINKERAQTEKQSLLTKAFVSGFALMLILSFFILRANRQKQKANKIISQQKEEVERQRNEVAKQKEETERQKETIQEKNKEIIDSINYAQKIQSAILPAPGDFMQKLAGSFLVFRPKDIVSGDFYWISEKEEYVFFTAADCTGHGVPGGFMSMLGFSLLNEIVNEKEIADPADILDLMRIKLITALRQKGASGENKDGMDMILCRHNKKTNELVYAAANNPLILVRGGVVTEYPADKQPVGIGPGEPRQFAQHSIQLEKGDCVYAYTDGYADQFGGPKGKKFKYRKLNDLLAEGASLPEREQKLRLESAFDSWRGNLEQVDDVCIIGLKI